MRRLTNIWDENSAKLMYRKHREYLKKVTSRIDVRPPRLMLTTFMNSRKIKQDHFALKRIIKDNITLLVRINDIQRNRGFTNNRSEFDSIRPTNLRQAHERLQVIQSENYMMGCRLLSAKSSMDTRRGLEELRSHSQKQKYVVPIEVIKKYSSIVMPQEQPVLKKLLRPKIYFDLEVKNIRPLGRVVIQLFTEACPSLVLHFVRMCTNKTLENFKFIRIFPMLWIEGELTGDDNVLTRPNYEYDMSVIDHSVGPGVFSFAKCYLNGFPKGLINFSISFKSLPVLNGERIPFALVTNGLRVLDCLQDYGTKNGKTQKDIVVVNCGMSY